MRNISLHVNTSLLSNKLLLSPKQRKTHKIRQSTVIGAGTYKVIDQQLLIIREIGPLVGKIEEAWENMLQTVNTAAADVADEDEEEGELPGAPSDFLQR